MRECGADPYANLIQIRSEQMLKELAQSRTRLTGTMLVEFLSPNVPRMLKASGFDYFIVDCEHGYFNYESVAHMIAVSKGIGLPVIVRIPDTTRTTILKYMDMGASGLLVPMVSDPLVLQQTVEHAKYRPLGKRGVALNRVHAEYIVPDPQAYMRRANQETIILGQIETMRGLERLDDIFPVTGVDGMILGPNDLMEDMPVADQAAADLLDQAMKAITAAASRHNKLSGIISSDMGLLQRGMDYGMQLMSWSSDVRMLMTEASSGVMRIQGMKMS
ncbi:hypothetical protein EBB07_04805 [Paenibacillaceae bacterium]|nr:hypothetical protein EBB07_04805 [Paenibacillaceae bacterium]